MLFEPAFLWFVPSEGTDTHAILVKASGNILKSIISGVPIQLMIGVNEINETEKHLCLALRIFDDANHPLLILKVQIDEEEHLAFNETLKRESTPLFLFDELNHCVAYAECGFDRTKVAELVRSVGDTSELYIGEFNEKTLYSLDCINFTVDSTRRSLEGFALGIALLA